MNIGMDYAWWAEDPWQLEFANTIQSFFNSKGIGDYHNKWTLDGREVEGNNHAHSPGLVACNAVASLAASDKVAWDFLEEFWNTGLTGGQYRYYDGCLYMLGLLHCTGNFKIYTSDTIVPGVKNSSITPASATFDKKEDLQKDIEVTMTLNGNELVNILNGSAPLRVNTDYSVNGSIVTLKKSYLASQENGSLKLTFDFSEGADRTLTVTIKESSDIPLSTEHIFSSGYDTGMVKFALNSGTAAYLSAGVGGKTDVLEITLNTKQNYEVVVFPFNIGSDKLSDYASIEVELAASNGNATYKNFSAYVAQIGGAFSHCDSGTSNLKITGSSRGLNNGSEWQLWSQPLTLSGGAENLTGIIEIAFGIPEYTEAGLKYQIKSIRLIKK